jgi:hypothetical protein
VTAGCRVDEAIDTDLFHNTRLPLGECDVTARLVGDELDLNLSPLASGLIVVIVVVVGRRGTLAFDAARLDGIAVSDGMLVEGGGRALVVLVADVGHCGQKNL